MDPNRCEYRLATTQEDVALYRAELKKMEHVEQRRAAIENELLNKYETISRQYDELHVAYHRDTGIPAGTASAPCEWGTPETSRCVPPGPPHNSTRLPAEGNNSSLSAAASNNNNPGWYSPGPPAIRDPISGSPASAPPPPAAQQHENWATDSPESDDPFDLEGYLPLLAPPPADNSDPHNVNNWLAEFETWDLSSDNGAQPCQGNASHEALVPAAAARPESWDDIPLD